MFSSDTKAETHRQHIFKQFPEHKKILIPLGKMSQLKVTIYVLECGKVAQFCVVSYTGQVSAFEKCFLLSKERLIALLFAKYASQKQYCLSSVKNILYQQCHVKEQYTKLWKIFIREVQDWEKKKKLTVTEEKFQILALE